jgi:hypothetical protein
MATETRVSASDVNETDQAAGKNVPDCSLPLLVPVFPFRQI